MPELRSNARRNRASINPNQNPNPINNILPQPDTNDNKKKSKFTVRTRQGRTAQNRKQKDAIVAAVYENKLNDNDNKHNNIVSGAGLETTPFGRKQDKDIKELRVLREEVAEKKMDEYDSGGRSGDKGPGAEDEGSTAPLPEKVSCSLDFSILFIW